MKSKSWIFGPIEFLKVMHKYDWLTNQNDWPTNLLYAMERVSDIFVCLGFHILHYVTTSTCIYLNIYFCITIVNNSFTHYQHACNCLSSLLVSCLLEITFCKFGNFCLQIFYPKLFTNSNYCICE